MMSRTWLLICAAACVSPALAQQPSSPRATRFADLPAWTGIWEGQVASEMRSDALGKTLAAAVAHPETVPKVAPAGVLSAAESILIDRTQLQQTPPYNEQWARRYEARTERIRATPASAVKPGSIMACSWDFPEIMDNPFDTLFEIFVTPEQTLMLFVNGQARHIYTDRPHPSADNLWPTDLGNSVAHWEKTTLVVDTIEHRGGPFIRIPFIVSPDLSEKARFLERIRMTDPDTLQDEMTIQDPSRLAHPWKVTLTFHRVKDLDRLIPTNCSDSNRFKVVKDHLSISP